MIAEIGRWALLAGFLVFVITLTADLLLREPPNHDTEETD